MIDLMLHINTCIWHKRNSLALISLIMRMYIRKKFDPTNLPQAGFELGSMELQAGMLPIEPPLLDTMNFAQIEIWNICVKIIINFSKIKKILSCELVYQCQNFPQTIYFLLWYAIHVTAIGPPMSLYRGMQWGICSPLDFRIWSFLGLGNFLRVYGRF